MPSNRHSKRRSRFPLLLGLSTLCVLAAYHDIEVIDGVTAATKPAPGTVVAMPKFSASVISGPALASGARLLEGQRLQMNIGISNPWKNNTVTMDVSPKLAGLTLTPTGNNTNPKWLLDWTPIRVQSNTSQLLTFRATFKSNAGNQTFDSSLNIPIGPHQPPALAAIPVQVAAVGQPIAINLSATTQDKIPVSFDVTPLPEGASISKPVLQKTGNWLATFNWIPTLASTGSNYLTISATDTYLNESTGNMAGSSSAQAVNIQVFSPPAITNAVVKSVTISTANWAAKTGTLNIKGKINVNTGKKLPANSTIQIGTGSQLALTQSTALVKPLSSGSFSATIKPLNAAQVPCMVTAQLLVNKVVNNLPGFMAVTGAPPASCIK